jgi:uncharacterized protein YqjF (DUF2071 family)
MAAGADGGKCGEFLGQLLGAAMRAFGVLPVAGADEDFAVALALPAMKLVNRHGWKIAGTGKLFKRRGGRQTAEYLQTNMNGDALRDTPLRAFCMASFRGFPG